MSTFDGLLLGITVEWALWMVEWGRIIWSFGGESDFISGTWLGTKFGIDVPTWAVPFIG